VDQAISCRLLTTEDRIEDHLGPYGVCVGQSVARKDVSPETSRFPFQYHCKEAQISLIYAWSMLYDLSN
jgi:hypothetical protein